MKSWNYALLLAVFVLTACDDKITGPDATLSSTVTPNVACNASDTENHALQTRVVLTADGDAGAFSPLPINIVAGDAGIALPTITLTSGDGGTPITVNQMEFVSNTELALWVTSATNGGSPIPGGTYTVTVTNPDGSSASATGALRITLPPVLTSATRLSPPVPANPADPNESRTVCNDTTTTLKLSGQNFRPADPKPIVQLVDSSGNLLTPIDPSNVTVVSPMEIDVTLVPPMDPTMRLAPGNYGFRITNPDGTLASGYPMGCHITEPNLITVVPPPTLTAIQPVAMCASQGTMFTATGMNFRPGSTIAIGSTPVAPITSGVTVNSPTMITFTIPPATVPVGGPYSITVNDPDGCSSTLNPSCPPGATMSGTNMCTKPMMGSGPEWLTVYPDPTVTGIAPMTVCGGGAMVMITGTGFHSTYGTPPTVTIDNMALTNVVVVNSTTITGNVPTIPAGGPYAVTVTLPEGCSATTTMMMGELTVMPGPTVAAIIPTQGWNGIDFPIVIIGTGFPGGPGPLPSGDSIQLVDHATGTVVATITGASPGFATVDASGTEINAYVPMGTAAGGPYDVVLNTMGCAVTLPNAFTVNNMPSFNVTGIIPPFGCTCSTTAVTITAQARMGSNVMLESTPRAYLVVPTAMPRLQPVRGDVFVSPTSMTAVVPQGLPVGGPYDVVVINPDGTAGVDTAAYRVTAMSPPVIDSITPQQGTTNGGAITITGANFRTGATAQLLPVTAGATMPPSCDPTMLPAGTMSLPAGTISMRGTQVATTYPANLPAQNFVVCVTDPDEMTYGEYGVFTVTNPAAKLGMWSTLPTTSQLNTGRRALGGAYGQINGANQFVYAIGGDNTTAALDSVEFSQLDIVGNLGSFTTQRYHLTQARTRPATILQSLPTGGGCMYAIGGSNTAAAVPAAADLLPATGNVERACILTFADAPVVNDPMVSPVTAATGGLGAGAWLYRVSAVKAATDAQNPSGETLPSDETTAFLAERSTVTLSWAAVMGADHYRVYRAPMVNATSGSEELLADNITTTMYTDNGSVTPPLMGSTDTPLRAGSTGVWTTMGIPQLNHPRDGASAVIASDATGNLYAYALGGAGVCTTGGTFGPMGCYEFAPITVSASGVTLGTWTSGTTTFGAHWSGAAGIANAATVSGYAGAAPTVYIDFGYDTFTTLSKTIDQATVSAGGQLGTFTSSSHNNINAGGFGGTIINSTIYVIGGETAPPPSAPTVGAFLGSVDTAGVVSSSISSLAAGMLPAARGYFGLVDAGAYFIALGGTATGNDAVNTVLQVTH